MTGGGTRLGSVMSEVIALVVDLLLCFCRLVYNLFSLVILLLLIVSHVITMFCLLIYCILSPYSMIIEHILLEIMKSLLNNRSTHQCCHKKPTEN